MQNDKSADFCGSRKRKLKVGFIAAEQTIEINVSESQNQTGLVRVQAEDELNLSAGPVVLRWFCVGGEASESWRASSCSYGEQGAAGSKDITEVVGGGLFVKGSVGEVGVLQDALLSHPATAHPNVPPSLPPGPYRLHLVSDSLLLLSLCFRPSRSFGHPPRLHHREIQIKNEKRAQEWGEGS